MTVLYIRYIRKVRLFGSLRVSFVHAPFQLLKIDVELPLQAVNIVLLVSVQLIRKRVIQVVSLGLYLERWLLVKMHFYNFLDKFIKELHISLHISKNFVKL